MNSPWRILRRNLPLALVLLMMAACSTPGDEMSGAEASSVSPEVRALIAEVQSDYMTCMVPKLPEYDDSIRDVATVAALLRESCSDEAANCIVQLNTVDASPEFRRVLVDEFQGSLEGHSIKLVEQWRDHINYREPPEHRYREGY